MERSIYAKRYRTVGLTMFIVMIALLVMRIISYYIQIAMIDVEMDGAWYELLIDALFTVPVQLGILLLFPFLMYKLNFKMSAKETLQFSNYHKCSPWVCLLAVPLGFAIIFVTMGVSVIWQMIIMLLGYTPSSSAATMPAAFNLGYFLLSVLMTAILPGLCEEFCIRGGLLTTVRSTHSKVRTAIIIGVAFGLFHQHILQVCYATFLGALMAYLVLETGSIFPSMILHFMNNFMSILLDNANTYNWGGLGGADSILNLSSENSLVVFGSIFALACLAVYGIMFAIVQICRKQKKRDLYLELNSDCVASGFRATLKDNIFFIGAIVVTVVSTFISFLFGL